jgi:hypothetical protein
MFFLNYKTFINKHYNVQDRQKIQTRPKDQPTTNIQTGEHNLAGNNITKQNNNVNSQNSHQIEH